MAGKRREGTRAAGSEKAGMRALASGRFLYPRFTSGGLYGGPPTTQHSSWYEEQDTQPVGELHARFCRA